MAKETKMVEEVKVHLLIMNPMTGNTENTQLIALSLDKDKLKEWYEAEIAPESYKDDGPNMFSGPATKSYHKIFKKGSVMEWMNPVANWDKLDHHGLGVHEEWTKEENIRTDILRID